MLVGKDYSFLSRAYFQKPRAVMLEGSSVLLAVGIPEMWGMSESNSTPLWMISHKIHVWNEIPVFFKNVGLEKFFGGGLWTWKCLLALEKYSKNPSLQMGPSKPSTLRTGPLFPSHAPPLPAPQRRGPWGPWGQGRGGCWKSTEGKTSRDDGHRAWICPPLEVSIIFLGWVGYNLNILHL